MTHDPNSAKPLLPVSVLDRVLAGTPEPSDTEALNRWIADSPERTRILEVLQGEHPSVQNMQRESGQDALRVLSERLDSARPRSAIRRQRTATGIWLSVALVALCAVLFRVPLRSTAHPTRQYATGLGQQASIVLTPGTRITLAPVSTLRMQGDALELVGEAYFDVAHATSTPFIIHTHTVTTRVLGTAFDVRRYAADSATRVAVTSGRVAVGARRLVTLPSGVVATVTDSTVTMLAGDATQYSSWTDGHLTFRRAPLRDVLTTVGRWYDVRFSMADSSMAVWPVTARLDFNSREEMLRALQLVLDVTMTFGDTVSGQARVVMLYPKTMHHSTAPARHDGTSVFPQTLERGR